MAIVVAIVVEVAATVFLLAFLVANGTGLQKIRTSSTMSRVRRPPYPFLVALLAALAAGCGSAASAGDRVSSVPVASADEASSLQQRFVSIVKAVSPEVVQIRTALALGSGVVFDARGDVVTNAHVVDNATRFLVTLASGDRHPATLVGRDAGMDLAVIRIKERDRAPRPSRTRRGSRSATSLLRSGTRSDCAPA